MYQVDSNVPLPDYTGKGRKPKYPFPRMGIGDSFAFDGGADEADRIRGAAKSYAAAHDTKYSVRQSGSQYRCWRTA